MDVSSKSSMFDDAHTLSVRDLLKQLVPAVVAVVAITVPLVVAMVMVWRYSRGYPFIPWCVSKRLSKRKKLDLEEEGSVRGEGPASEDRTTSPPLPAIPLFLGTTFQTEEVASGDRVQSAPKLEVQQATMDMQLPCSVDGYGFTIIELGPAHVAR